mgnify:CR=1 FL=1
MRLQRRDDGRHRVEREPVTDELRHGGDRIDDRREPEPELHQDRHGLADVARVHVERAEKRREARGEGHQQRDDGNGCQRDPSGKPAGHDEERHENSERDGEIDERRENDDHRKARLGKARLLQQVAVLDEHAGAALNDLDEQTPREHARAQGRSRNRRCHRPRAAARASPARGSP